MLALATFLTSQFARNWLFIVLQHSVVLSAHESLCSWPIYKYGTEEQKQKYLTALASGEKLGAFGLTEPGAGTDAAMQKTVAKDEGDHWVLNGSKVFITNAQYADIFVVFAMVYRPDYKENPYTNHEYLCIYHCKKASKASQFRAMK